MRKGIKFNMPKNGFCRIVVGLLIISITMSFVSSCAGNDDRDLSDFVTPDATESDRVFDQPILDGDLTPEKEITSAMASEILQGHDPRDGYIVAPTMMTATGVDPLSLFVLQVPTGSGESVVAIAIDGKDTPTITRIDDETFVITPLVPLTPNSIYVLRLTLDIGEDITWAFQTIESFEIISTLPRDQGVNVPIRTGIEITFSGSTATDISEHFSIYPHVEGSFISRDSTAIFMPASPLEHGRIYTVTIRAGLSTPDISGVMTADYRFSFETAPDITTQARLSQTSVRFLSRYIEYPSFAPPVVDFRLTYDRDSTPPPIQMNVYRFYDRDSAVAAIERFDNVPRWSHIQTTDRFVDTSDMTRVSSSTFTRRVSEDNRWRWSETFTFADTLPPGYYVLEAVVSGVDIADDQMIIQITDLAVQTIGDENKTLLWINDMTTGQPASGARVFDPIDKRLYEASAYGIAHIERQLSFGEYLIITADDGKECVLFVNSSGTQSFFGRSDWDIMEWSPGRNPFSSNSQYWSVLQLDRTLFQRSDTVSLWGFVQNRRTDEDIRHVTAVITSHSRRSGASERDTLIRQNISVRNGAYSGEISLPNLDPGTYELAVFHGDIALGSVHFTIMDYTKPPYQMSVSASRYAIFAGEEVTITTRTEFFEGTPVPDLDISYDFWGRDLSVPRHGQQRTNLDGVLEITVGPTATGDAQGERRLNFTAEATLPEMGWVSRETSVRVFTNDIEVSPRATRTGRNANLTIGVHNIDLSRLNDGTAENWRDYLGNPVRGQRMSVEIVEVYWERIPDGQRYDHVTRRTITRYRFERRENSLERFELTTDAQGHVSRDFTVPDTRNRSYQARLTTTDGNGRRISHNVHIGRDFTSFFNNANDELPFLYGVEPNGYDIGDPIRLSVMHGTELLNQGNFLFVVVQDEILSYHIGRNTLSLTFTERHAPNVQVFAYHFNGHTYHTDGAMTQRLRYNPTVRNLTISVEPCNDAYRPGDTVTIRVRTTDPGGNPKAANVNISLVDEALFALMDYSVDTLSMLYGNVSDRLRLSHATHSRFISAGIDSEYDILEEAADEVPRAAADGGRGDETRIRERFEDTAVFRSLRTNANGQASFTFTLPDNITSWRATASAVSEDLYAGNTIQNIRVTQPMFLHYSFGSVFLVGDTPYVGVNVYGSDLSGGERVSFEVWRESAPDDIRRAQGVSFERVNIPLWRKAEEGFDSIVIRATMADGKGDAVRHAYQVRSSHRTVDIARFYEVTPDIEFDINPTGLTNITFIDHGRGQFLNDLYGLRRLSWRSGARIEGLIARREATRLIRTHFPDAQLFGEDGNFDISEYQLENGGIALLPYSDADLLTTVMLIPFIMEDANLIALSSYLRDEMRNVSIDDRVLALYGLALLGEPVLFELEEFSQKSDLSIRNTAFVALGLAAIGETQPARELYQNRIAPYIQDLSRYSRVNLGATREEILDVTSITALLAARLGLPESIDLYNYVRAHRFDAPWRFEDDAFFMNIERLKFISYEIENFSDTEASITYTLFGETITRDLGSGGRFTLRIPAQNMHEFELVSTTGQVGAVSIVRTPLEQVEQIDNDLSVSRLFFRAGSGTPTTTFEQGDLVRVQITVDYTARTLSGSFVITDFLPAGLVHVADSARTGDRQTTPGWWVRTSVEGQRITFFDWNGRFTGVHTYYYYARVINPGIFMAEGTMVQSVGAREYMTLGEEAKLMINP